MFNVYYDMINKRKSFHTMPGEKKISGPELDMIKNHFARLVPLCNDIKIAFKIVQRHTTTWKWGEYAILVYSEKKPNYLANIGYMVQQLEMFLTALDIGTCWCGIGQPKEEDKTYEGMDFAIMLIMEKSEEGQFRKSMHEAKRREADKIKTGEGFDSIAEVARFAPSAVNFQPWLMECEGNKIRVYRKSMRMAKLKWDSISFFQRMDVGIFIFFIEMCLKHEKKDFTRTLYIDKGEDLKELLAEYTVNN